MVCRPLLLVVWLLLVTHTAWCDDHAPAGPRAFSSIVRGGSLIGLTAHDGTVMVRRPAEVRGAGMHLTEGDRRIEGPAAPTEVPRRGNATPAKFAFDGLPGADVQADYRMDDLNGNFPSTMAWIGMVGGRGLQQK